MDARIRVSPESRRGCGYRNVGGIYAVGGKSSSECKRLPIPCHTCPVCSGGIKPARGYTWVDGDALIASAPPCPDWMETHPAACSACTFGGSQTMGRVGLIWIGGNHYPTVNAFVLEAIDRGISRRLPAIPSDFVVGETRILLGHRKAISETQTIKIENPFDLEDDNNVDALLVEAIYPRITDQLKRDGFLMDGDIVLRVNLPAGPDGSFPGSIVQVEVQRIVYTPGIFSSFVPEALEYIVDGSETTEAIDRLIARGLSPVKVERVGEQLPFMRPVIDISSSFWTDEASGETPND